MAVQLASFPLLNNSKYHSCPTPQKNFPYNSEKKNFKMLNIILGKMWGGEEIVFLKKIHIQGRLD